MARKGSITATLNNIPLLRDFWRTKTGKLMFARLYNVIIRLLYLLISDRRLNTLVYKIKKNTNLNLSDPQTFSEKVIFLKLYYRNPLMTICSDKYYVNEYVKARGYSEILKETYGVYRNVEEIDVSKLPDRFFLKCNHISKYNMYVKNKDEVDIAFFKKLYKIIMKRNYYYAVREWCYKDIAPLIIAEECLTDENGDLPVDYKFYCFSGEPKYFMVSHGEYEGQERNHKFDMGFNSIDHHFKDKSSLAADEVQKPINFEKMVEIVQDLCRPFPHVRVDLYNINGRIYFGELTFYSNGGFINVKSREMDLLIGSWIRLEDYTYDLINS